MSPVSQRSVLVVDDNQPSVISMGILLKRLDYSVLTALNTFDAIKAIANMHPAVVFMNIRMTGIAACLAHISKDARLKATPVVMMGEKPDTKIMEECLKKGAAAYIIKPINPTSIYRVIQKLTEKKPRENVRVRVIFKTAVTYQNFRKISYATMLSENGVFIRALKPIPVGTKVVVSMDLPSEKPIEVEGVVIYTVAFNKDQFVEPGICIRFFNIDKTTQLGLRKFIEDQLVQDLDPNIDI